MAVAVAVVEGSLKHLLLQEKLEKEMAEEVVVVVLPLLLLLKAEDRLQ